jgi:hypothetical protein
MLESYLDFPRLYKDLTHTLSAQPCPRALPGCAAADSSCSIPQDILVTTKWSSADSKAKKKKVHRAAKREQQQQPKQRQQQQQQQQQPKQQEETTPHTPTARSVDRTALTASDSTSTATTTDDCSVQRSPPPPPKLADTESAELPPEITFYRRRRDWDLPVSRVKVHWHRETNVKHFYGIHKWKGQLYYTTAADDDDQQPPQQHSLRTVVGTIVCYEIQPLSSVRKSGHGATLLRSVDASLSKLSLLASSTSLQAETLWLEHWENLPCLLISHVSVPPKYRGLGLGLALLDDACRKPGRDIPWVLVAHPADVPGAAQRSPSSQRLVDYFALLGFCPDIFGSSFGARWNDLQHGNLPRIDNLCPHLPSSSLQESSHQADTSPRRVAPKDKNVDPEDDDGLPTSTGCGAVFSSTNSSSRCRRRRRVW